ncbi:hypothetical protein Pcinc_020642 [Petrolisthes cinctipes]|uniref:Uncharacterized protein n=1 Tax=Petrolisthes cinctipes TaxID=88211 RepID=A0AAE1FM20_PETCI|nr:hypothetical protein Pcinc_020642 [Petrolisthes cinctipes]
MAIPVAGRLLLLLACLAPLARVEARVVRATTCSYNGVNTYQDGEVLEAEKNGYEVQCVGGVVRLVKVGEVLCTKPVRALEVPAEHLQGQTRAQKCSANGEDKWGGHRLDKVVEDCVWVANNGINYNIYSSNYDYFYNTYNDHHLHYHTNHDHNIYYHTNHDHNIHYNNHHHHTHHNHYVNYNANYYHNLNHYNTNHHHNINHNTNHYHNYSTNHNPTINHNWCKLYHERRDLQQWRCKCTRTRSLLPHDQQEQLLFHNVQGRQANTDSRCYANGISKWLGGNLEKVDEDCIQINCEGDGSSTAMFVLSNHYVNNFKYDNNNNTNYYHNTNHYHNIHHNTHHNYHVNYYSNHYYNINYNTYHHYNINHYTNYDHNIHYNNHHYHTHHNHYVNYNANYYHNLNHYNTNHHHNINHNTNHYHNYSTNHNPTINHNWCKLYHERRDLQQWRCKCTRTRSLLPHDQQEQLLFHNVQGRQANTDSRCYANGISKWLGGNLEKVDEDCIQINCEGDGSSTAMFVLSNHYINNFKYDNNNNTNYYHNTNHDHNIHHNTHHNYHVNYYSNHYYNINYNTYHHYNINHYTNYDHNIHYNTYHHHNIYYNTYHYYNINHNTHNHYNIHHYTHHHYNIHHNTHHNYHYSSHYHHYNHSCSHNHNHSFNNTWCPVYHKRRDLQSRRCKCTRTRSLLPHDQQEQLLFHNVQGRQANTDSRCYANGISKWLGGNLEKVDEDCIQINCEGDGSSTAMFVLSNHYVNNFKYDNNNNTNYYHNTNHDHNIHHNTHHNYHVNYYSNHYYNINYNTYHHYNINHYTNYDHNIHYNTYHHHNIYYNTHHYYNINHNTHNHYNIHHYTHDHYNIHHNTHHNYHYSSHYHHYNHSCSHNHNHSFNNTWCPVYHKRRDLQSRRCKCSRTRSLLHDQQEQLLFHNVQGRQANTDSRCYANGISKWLGGNLEKVDEDCIQINCEGDGSSTAMFVLRLNPWCNCPTTTTTTTTTTMPTTTMASSTSTMEASTSTPQHCEEESTTTEAPTTVSTTDMMACETEDSITTV